MPGILSRPEQQDLVPVPTNVKRSWWWKHVKIEGDNFICTVRNCNYKFTRSRTANPTRQGSRHFKNVHMNLDPQIKAAKQLEVSSNKMKNFAIPLEKKKTSFEDRKPYDKLNSGIEAYTLILKSLSQAQISYKSFDGHLGDLITCLLRQSNLSEFGKEAPGKNDKFPQINANFNKDLNKIHRELRQDQLLKKYQNEGGFLAMCDIYDLGQQGSVNGVRLFNKNGSNFYGLIQGDFLYIEHFAYTFLHRKRGSIFENYSLN